MAPRSVLNRRFVLAAALVAASVVATSPVTPPAAAMVAPTVDQLVVDGPPGSEFFGGRVTVLENGNYIVVDPGWDSPIAVDVGAVYLYDGRTNTVISTLTGSSANDRVGSGSDIYEVGNSNAVVVSQFWDNGTATRAGAVT